MRHQDVVERVSWVVRDLPNRRHCQVFDWPIKIELFTQWIIATPTTCSLVRVVQRSGSEESALVAVIGAGPAGLQPHPDVFRYVATQNRRIEYGALFASVCGDGLVLVGSRLVIPGGLFNTADNQAFTYALANIEHQALFGANASAELCPKFGGRQITPANWQDLEDLSLTSFGT